MENSELEMVIRYLKGESDGEERKQMEKWLEDDTNKQDFEQLKKIWQASGEVYNTYSPDLDKARQKIQSHITEKQTKHPRNFVLWKWAGRAAAVLIAALGLTWAVMHFNTNNKILSDASLKEISTKATLDSVVLSDGSVIWLNHLTTVRYPETFAGEERKVFLSGEAFFEVTRNEEKPFVAETQGTVTKVLGTTFNIKTDGNKASIAVLTGKVSFSENGNSDNFKFLTKNEKAQFDAASHSISTSRLDDPNLLAWKTGTLVFQNASLSQIAATLSEHYHTPISLDITHPESLSLTTSFERQSLEEVLEVICMTLNLRYEAESEGYVLKR